MGLVNCDQADRKPAQTIKGVRLHQAFRRQVEKTERALTGCAPRLSVYLAVLTVVDGCRLDAERAQGCDLVLHQGDQRRDDDGEPAKHQSGNLVDQRLPRAGRHDGEDVLAGKQRVDGFLLPGAEFVKAEAGLEDLGLGAVGACHALSIGESGGTHNLMLPDAGPADGGAPEPGVSPGKG